MATKRRAKVTEEEEASRVRGKGGKLKGPITTTVKARGFNKAGRKAVAAESSGD